MDDAAAEKNEMCSKQGMLWLSRYDWDQHTTGRIREILLGRLRSRGVYFEVCPSISHSTQEINSCLCASDRTHAIDVCL